MIGKKIQDFCERKKIFIHEGEVISSRPVPMSRIISDIVFFLEKYQAENISRRGNRIAFTGMTNSGELRSKFLMGIAYGYITVEKKENHVSIGYTLNLKPYIKDSILVAAIVVSLIVFTSVQNWGMICGMILFLFIALITLYKITVTRFRFYMEDIINGKYDKDQIAI